MRACSYVSAIRARRYAAHRSGFRAVLISADFSWACAMSASTIASLRVTGLPAKLKRVLQVAEGDF